MKSDSDVDASQFAQQSTGGATLHVRKSVLSFPRVHVIVIVITFV